MQNILYTQLKIKTHLNNIITTKTVTRNNCLFRRNKGSQTYKQNREKDEERKSNKEKLYYSDRGSKIISFEVYFQASVKGKLISLNKKTG